MATMTLRLTFCLLVLGLARSLENSSESEDEKQGPSKKDNVIYFKAFLPEETEYEVKSTIVFSSVQHNIGGGYNPTTGVFTAPVTGLYEFKCRVSRQSGAVAEIALFNEKRLRASTTFLHNWETYGISSVMKVKKGDHVSAMVYWSVDSNTVTLRPGYFNQFSGYLIRQL